MAAAPLAGDLRAHRHGDLEVAVLQQGTNDRVRHGASTKRKGGDSPKTVAPEDSRKRSGSAAVAQRVAGLARGAAASAGGVAGRVADAVHALATVRQAERVAHVAGAAGRLARARSRAHGEAGRGGRADAEALGAAILAAVHVVRAAVAGAVATREAARAAVGLRRRLAVGDGAGGDLAIRVHGAALTDGGRGPARGAARRSRRRRADGHRPGRPVTYCSHM